MKYIGMPLGMWLLFKDSFQKNMVDVLHFDRETAAAVATRAKPKYKEIIARLPEFEKGDRFQMDIVNCALLSAFLQSIKEKPPLGKLTEYYSRAMMTAPMKWFCRMSGKKKFTPKDIQAMKETAAFRAGDRNPYSWNMDFMRTRTAAATRHGLPTAEFVH